MRALLLVSLAGQGSAGEPPATILVSPEWLAERLGDPTLVVVQVAELRSDYARGHIPGARFLWPGWLEMSSPDLNVELCSVAAMDSILESLGISNTSQVVLCHTYQLASAASVARAWAMLDYLGMGDRTKVLDGGYETWAARGFPVTKEVPEHGRGTFTPRIKEGVFVDLEYVKARMGRPGVRLVDTRRPADFAGGAKGDLRTGHIPGAVSLPYASVIDEGLCYSPADTLRSRFSAAGIQPGDAIVAYCYRGKSACFTYVAARTLGYEVHVYDGSFEEWCGHEELPLEMSAGEK